MSDLYLKQGVALMCTRQKTGSDGKNINWSGFSAHMQIRDYPSGIVKLDLSTANGKISIDGENVTFYFTQEDMASLSVAVGTRAVEAPDCSYVYAIGVFDIIMAGESSLSTPVFDEGAVYLDPLVTQ